MDLHTEIQALIALDEKHRIQNKTTLNVYWMQGLSERQADVLRLIANNPGIRVTDMARRLGISEGRVRQIVMVLRKRRRVEMPYNKPPLYGFTPESEYLREVEGRWL